MCGKSDIFHRCGHWRRTLLAPCVRARIVNGNSAGCGYDDELGASNSSKPCPSCRHEWRGRPENRSPSGLISRRGQHVHDLDSPRDISPSTA